MAKIAAIKSGGGSITPTALIPILSSATSDVVANTNFPSGEQPYYAFDGNDSTFCANYNSNEWYIGYQFSNPVKLNYITLKTRPNFRANNTNQLEYLINGTWTRIIGLLFDAASTEYTYQLDSDVECDGIRVRNPSGANYDGFISIQVYGNYA